MKACVVNLGCKVNRIESDWMERSLSELGCEPAGEGSADIVVINTCAVTGEAEAKTRKAIRHAVSLPQRPLVCVTGCVANLFPEEARALGERVHVVADKANVAREALRLFDEQARVGAESAEHGCLAPDSTAAANPTESVSVAAAPTTPAVSHGHEASTYETRLRRGVKVQDGCDNRCTYCIVWRARGPVRSSPLPEVERQVGTVLAEGAGEVVLSGINLGRYRDTAPDGAPIALDGLLRRVSDLARERAIVRASSIEPPDVTPELAHAMAELRGVVCPHLHLPLQSGCDATLARMGRAYDTKTFADVVEMVRSELPELSLSTDVIVGFPGETDEEFEQTLAFCREMRFSKMHVFRFSARPDTPAASMPNQVDPRVAQVRSERLRTLADELRATDAAARVGTVEPVLVERIAADGSARGTTASYHRAVVEAPQGMVEPVTPGLVRACIESYDPRTRLLHARVVPTGA